MKSSIENILFICAVVVFSLGCNIKEQDEAPKDLTNKIILQFTNEDVIWNGSLFGVMGSLNDKEKIFSKNRDKIDYSTVYKYLDDKKRFVVAHYFLAYGTLTKHTVSGSEWNGLKVNIGEKIIVPEAQIPKLKKLWEKYKLPDDINK